MAMKRYFPVICLLILLVSCSHNSKGLRAKAVYIDLNSKNTVSFYDLFSKMELIPLETNDSSLIKGYNLSVKIHNNRYYILDKNQNQILIFNMEGKYIRSISKQGNGPGEYSELYDFDFNRFSGDLELLSPVAGIYVYDSLGIIYRHHVKLPSSMSTAHNFIAINPNQYLFYSDTKTGTKMALYDDSLKNVVSETYNLSDDIIKTLYHHVYSPFYLYNDFVHFVQAYNGDNFVYVNQKLQPKYSWDFGEYNFEIKNLPAGKDIRYYLEWNKTFGTNYATIFIQYSENSNYYFTAFYWKRKIYHLLIDKRNNRHLLFNSFKEMNFFSPIFVDEKYAYAIIPTDLLNTYVSTDLLDKADYKKLNSLDDDANPIILKYTFKNSD